MRAGPPQQRMGRSLELRLGNACAQSPGCLACELMGGGEEPAWAGTKAGSRAAASGWSDPESWGELVLTGREPYLGFLEEVSAAIVDAGATPQYPLSFLLPSPNPEPPPGSLAGRSRALPAPARKFCAGLCFTVVFSPAAGRVSTPSQSFSSSWEFAHCLPPTLLLLPPPDCRCASCFFSAPPRASSRVFSGFLGTLFWAPVGFPTGCRGG